MRYAYTVLAILFSVTLSNAQSATTSIDKDGNTVLKDTQGKILLVGTKDIEGNIIWKNPEGESLEAEVLTTDVFSLSSLDKAIIRANKKED